MRNSTRAFKDPTANEASNSDPCCWPGCEAPRQHVVDDMPMCQRHMFKSMKVSIAAMNDPSIVRAINEAA